MIETKLLKGNVYLVSDSETGASTEVAIPQDAEIGDYAHAALYPEQYVPTLDELRKIKSSEINKACEAELSALQSAYPESEVLSWDKQEREARAFVADPAAPVPLISNLAAVRGISVSDLANRIIQKADAYTAAIGAALGKRQKLEDQLNALTDWESMAEIKW